MVDAREAFEVVDLRVGRITRAEVNVEAKKPAYKLWVDLGELGEKTSSAQLTIHYTPESLVGKLVIAAVNLGSVRIAGFKSEVLVLGVDAAEGGVVLLAPDQEVPVGRRIY